MDLQSFYVYLKEQGILWPNMDKELYDPVNGHYVYGPFGTILKNTIENYIRDQLNDDNYNEIRCPLIYPKNVWVNSGHWNNFHDPVISTKSGLHFRLDKLIEEQLNLNTSDMSKEDILKLCSKLECPKDDPFIISNEVQYKNLMLITQSGNDECALRPETATTTYTSFISAYNYYGKKLPIKIYQVGYAFRNEISCRNLTLRMREFTQIEAHIFINSDDKNNCNEYDDIKHTLIPAFVTQDTQSSYSIQHISLEELVSNNKLKSKFYAYTLYRAYNIISKILSKDKIRIRQHADNEKAFYALDAWDIEYNLNNVGWTEICGIHDRGDYDLTQHKLQWEKIPHILEIAIGLDRLIFALLDTYYDKKDRDIGKSILHIPIYIAPIQIAILPLVKNKLDILNTSKSVYKILKKYFRCIYDDKQSIGKRYLKSSLQGIPFCVTIDYTTLDDNTVTVRDRDTGNQFRSKINDLISKFMELFDSAE